MTSSYIIPQPSHNSHRKAQTERYWPSSRVRPNDAPGGIDFINQCTSKAKCLINRLNGLCRVSREYGEKFSNVQVSAHQPTIPPKPSSHPPSLPPSQLRYLTPQHLHLNLVPIPPSQQGWLCRLQLCEVEHRRISIIERYKNALAEDIATAEIRRRWEILKQDLGSLYKEAEDMVSKALGNNHDPDQDEAHVSPLTKQDDWNEYSSPDDITQFFSAFLHEYRQRKENLGNQLSQFLQLLSQEVEVPNTQDSATRDSVLVAVAKAFVEESTRLQEVDINWDRNAVGAAPRCTISHPDSQKYDI